MKFLILSWIVLLAGCTSVQQYDGPKRPDTEIAVIEKGINSIKRIKISKVNGCLKGIDKLDRYEFLPGAYTLTFSYISSTARGNSIDLNVDLKAGHKYELKHKVYRNPLRWSVWIVDKKSGKVVSTK